MKQTRDELIEQLGNMVKKHFNSGISHKISYTMKRWELELVADFIIADRKRICAPLLEVPLKFEDSVDRWEISSIYLQAIEEILELAGIEEDK